MDGREEVVAATVPSIAPQAHAFQEAHFTSTNGAIGDIRQLSPPILSLAGTITAGRWLVLSAQGSPGFGLPARLLLLSESQ